MLKGISPLTDVLMSRGMTITDHTSDVRGNLVAGVMTPHEPHYRMSHPGV